MLLVYFLTSHSCLDPLQPGFPFTAPPKPFKLRSPVTHMSLNLIGIFPVSISLDLPAAFDLTDLALLEMFSTLVS